MPQVGSDGARFRAQGLGEDSAPFQLAASSKFTMPSGTSFSPSTSHLREFFPTHSPLTIALTKQAKGGVGTSILCKLQIP